MDLSAPEKASQAYQSQYDSKSSDATYVSTSGESTSNGGTRKAASHIDILHSSSIQGIGKQLTDAHEKVYTAMSAKGPQHDAQMQSWSSHRVFLFKMVQSPCFEIFVDATIVLNVCIIIYQADYLAQCYPVYEGDLENCPYNMNNISWVRYVNLLLLSWYTVEGLIRIYTDRIAFFRSKWNRFDALVVIINWSGELAGASLNLAFLRFLRLVRLARAVRVLVHSRELMLLISGVVSSVRAIFYGSLMLFMMLVVYSIILVEWLHPMNSKIEYFGCFECTFAFKSVWRAVLTLFKELIAGQTWIMSFELVEQNWLVAPIVIFIVVTTILGVMNLILAVIVERASEAHARDVADVAKQKMKEQKHLKSDLLEMCREMDKDQSGTLSILELRDAFAESPDFRNNLMLLDIHENDCEMLFKILDRDGSGDVNYTEFCDSLVELESNDTRLVLAMMRLSIEETVLGMRRLEADVKNLGKTSHVQFRAIRHKINQIPSDAPERDAFHKNILGETIQIESGLPTDRPHSAQKNPSNEHADLLKDQCAQPVSASWRDSEHMREDLAVLVDLERDLMAMTQGLLPELLEHSQCLSRYEAYVFESNTEPDGNDHDDGLRDCPSKNLSHIKAPLGSLRRNVSEQLHKIADHVGPSRATVNSIVGVSRV